MNSPKKINQKLLAREAIARQEWMTYISPGSTVNISKTLVDKIVKLARKLGLEAGVMDAMQVVANQDAIDYDRLRQEGDPIQVECVLNRPGLRAIHFLGMDGEIWASEFQFYAYE